MKKKQDNNFLEASREFSTMAKNMELFIYFKADLLELSKEDRLVEERKL